MDTGLMILGFLMSGPKTGYKIKRISGKMMVSYNLSLNQIYPALRKLEESDLVRKEVVIQTGKPNKHVYTVTTQGRELFYKKLTAAPTPVDYQIDFLTRAFFFRFLEGGQILEQFVSEISALDEQLEDLRQMEIETCEVADENGRFVLLTIIDMLEGLKAKYAEELRRRSLSPPAGDI